MADPGPGALRDDLLTALALLTSKVMEADDASVDTWIAANDRAAERATTLLTEIRRAESFDVTNLSVALRQLRQSGANLGARRLTHAIEAATTGSVGIDMSTTPRYRFAPSPTGFFHVGGARTALFNWALAHSTGGTFVLRIEDTDEARNRPEWTQGIIDSLAWIGISSDDPHFEGPLFQSDFADAHLAAAQQLYEGGHAYYCEMTPDEIQNLAKAEGVTGYAGWSRDLGLGRAPAGYCDSGCPTARPSCTIRCGAGSSSTMPRSRTSCWCAATALRCSCSRT